MKLFKRLLKFVLPCAVLAIVGAGVVYYRSQQRPDWYAHVTSLDPATRAEAARQAQNTMIASREWLVGNEAAERRGESSPAQASAAGDLSVSFTEDQLNALFQKWNESFHWDDQYGQYLADPAIALYDGRIVLAGTMRGVDRVVSLHFKPAIDANGRVTLDLERVMAGQLPMPAALFNVYRQRLGSKVASALPPMQQAARLLPDGSVNDEAMMAAMGQLMVAVLNRTSAEPVLFLTKDLDKLDRCVPVKLKSFKVEGDSVSLAVEMMSLADRQAYIHRLRGGHVDLAPTP